MNLWEVLNNLQNNSRIRKLEKRLRESKNRLNELAKEFSTNYDVVEKDFYIENQENLKLQRELSLAKNEETAMQIEWKYNWDIGAPCPYVISSGSKTFLIYLVNEPDQNCDGSYVNIVDASSEVTMPTALVEFIDCYAHKFGGANDEVIYGHPLKDKGLEGYSAHRILNSRWLAEEEKINSVHSYYSKDRWLNKNHYMLLFHDEIFECIATDYKIELIRDSFSSVLMEAQRRIFL
jgi:hypothetical protein